MVHSFPYRDWLGILGMVVFSLQWSVLGHWGRICVQWLKIHTSSQSFAVNTIQSAALLLYVYSDLTQLSGKLLCCPNRHLMMMTHLVSRAVGLLRGRGLVLGWTPETQTHTQHTHSCLVSHENRRHVVWHFN